jgi:hypothetical protein
MIVGQGLTYQLNDGVTITCEDFSYGEGIIYLPYSKKDIFSFLSLSGISLVSGSLSVDNIKLIPTGFVGGSAKVIDLDVQDIGSLFFVSYYDGDGKNADATFKKFVSQLSTLKSSFKNAKSQTEKIQKLMAVLSSNKVSYVLIDLNNPLVQKNKADWEKAFLSYTGTIFCLSKNLLNTYKNPTKENPSKKTTIPLLFQIPLVVTAFFAIFLASYVQTLRMQSTSTWPIWLIIAIMFWIGNLTIEFFLTRKIIAKTMALSVFTFFEIQGTLLNLIGIALGIFVSWILAYNDILFVRNVFSGVGLASVALFGAGFLFAPSLIGHVEIRRKNEERHPVTKD